MKNKTIYSNKAFLPPIKEYTAYLKKAYKKGKLTDYSILLTELEEKLKKYLGVNNIQCVTSGTTALQMALKAFNFESESEVITVPFSYVATTTAILSENLKPVYCDIEQNNFTIDADKIENLITEKTKAILPVHIFGYICNIEKIEQIGKKYKLKIIYDAAHAFGERYKDKSIFEYGDVSCVSFQETKLFHTAEGGALFTNNEYLNEQYNLIKQCGHIGDNYIRDGFNARLSELHAAMGLANLKYIDKNIKKRKELSEYYDKFFSGIIKLPSKQKFITYNYPYYVIILNSNEELKKVQNKLYNQNIYSWHCYYPTLNKLRYLKEYQECPAAEDICSRILMLPLYPDLDKKDVKKVAETVLSAIQ